MSCEIVLICEIEEYQANLISRYFSQSKGNPSMTASGLGQRQVSNNIDTSRSYQEAQKMILKGPDYEKLVKDLQTDATAYRPHPHVKNNRISHEVGRITNSPMAGGPYIKNHMRGQSIQSLHSISNFQVTPMR